jgi:hypothetical protein
LSCEINSIVVSKDVQDDVVCISLKELSYLRYINIKIFFIIIDYIMIKTAATEPDSIVETPEERRKRFLLEFERPFKCEKCNERFKKKKYLREHKSEVHSY